MRSVAIVVVLALLALSAHAESIKWTGIADNNQWDTANNWYPNTVPGPADDVTIPKGSVIITTPVTVSSIGMGTQFSESGNLTVDSSLTVGTLTVEGNGYLIMASGASAVSGTVNVAGHLLFSSGKASGTWTMSSASTTELSSAGEKTFSGCGFNVAGSISATGLIVLNQSSQFKVTSTITTSGDFSIQAQDTTQVLFDTSSGTLTYTGHGTFSVQAPLNLGTFNFQGGNLTLYDSVTFVNSFAIPSGSVVKSLGLADISMPGGVSGSGYLHAEGHSLSMSNANFSGTLNAQAGVVSFAAASTIATVLVDGASVVVPHKLHVDSLSLVSGSLNGDSTVTAASTTITSSGFTLNASLVFSGDASCTGSVISFQTPGKITVSSGATFTASSSVQFTGPAGTGGFVNHGILDAKGAVSFQNIDVSGTGSVTVKDTLHVNTITFTQSTVALDGSGVFKGSSTDITNIGSVTGTPSVTATIGSYSFNCGTACKDVKTTGIPTSKFHFAVGH